MERGKGEGVYPWKHEKGVIERRGGEKSDVV